MTKGIGLWSTLKRWLGKKLPHFWSYVSPMLVQTSLSLVVRCHSTIFCLKSSFASLRFRYFALIRILCRFIKFTVTCFLMIASGSLVISQCKLSFGPNPVRIVPVLFSNFFVFRNCSPHNLFTILEPLNNLKYSINILSILIWILAEIYSTVMKKLRKM